jgi:hypothetical protein
MCTAYVTCLSGNPYGVLYFLFSPCKKCHSKLTIKKPDFLLIFILLTGVALRFYGFPQIPFMYDEVSAWARTGFTSFHELIEKGVKGDGHPAGVQVFLNYWRLLFGDSEAAFKLPFLIMGIFSILLIYKIGSRWFNRTTGYLAAAFAAVLQYTVMYSQVARPYASGLFFSLCMVWCWTNYLFNDQTIHKLRPLAGFIFFAILCCYNHYFSLLFAFITGVTGLFFLTRENRNGYLVAGFIIIILFLPHISITRSQLTIGGVGGWLAKPTFNFFGDYINYVFDFSFLLKSIVFLLIVAGIIFHTRELKRQQKFRIIALAWFLLPVLIGFFYSVNRNAVLQYSVLIFSFPYLLLLAFSFFREMPQRFNSLMVGLIIVTGSYGLIVERDHYQVFYHQPVEQLVRNSLETSKRLAGNEITVLLNEPPRYAGYYLGKYDASVNFDYWPQKDFQSYPAFRKYLSGLSSSYFIAGNIPSDYLMQVKQFYPYKVEMEKGFTYNYFCFSKNNTGAINDRLFSDSLNFKDPGEYWLLNKNAVQTDSVSLAAHYRMDSSIEFGPSFSAMLYPLLTNEYNVLNVSMKISDLTSLSEASLVISLKEGDKQLFWQEKPFDLFMDAAETKGTIFYSISLRDLGLKLTPDLKVEIYAWNKSRSEFNIDAMNVYFEQGNPLIYGLIEKVPARKFF